MTFDWQTFQAGLVGEATWVDAEDLGRMSIDRFMAENAPDQAAQGGTGMNEMQQIVNDARAGKMIIAVNPRGEKELRDQIGYDVALFVEPLMPWGKVLGVPLDEFVEWHQEMARARAELLAVDTRP